MKTIARIPFTEIDSIPELIKDFLNGEVPGFKENQFTLRNVELIIEKKTEFFTPTKRELITEILGEQNKNLTDRQKINLENLKDDSTFTVCTGHQLNFFTGPVFFIYKILQTIKTCQYLEQKMEGKKFVPIFWMATEDHDFEEIAQFHAFGEKYLFPNSGKGAVGRLEIPEDHLLSKFEKDTEHLPYAEELIEIAKSAYSKGKTLADATRILVQNLFAEFGLLVLDGDSHSLKKEMISVFKDEIINHSLSQQTAEQVNALTKKYSKVQVNPRDINLFYILEDRNRIEIEDEFFRIVDTDLRFSKKEMLEIVEKYPERISPNAVMRPVYQETVLPNIAYIGGNAEIMYWLELKDYFQYLNIPFPVLIPRSSILILTEKQERKLVKLGLSAAQLLEPSQKIINEKILSESAFFDQFGELRKTLNVQFKNLEQIAEKTDVTFGNLVEAEKTRQTRSLHRMEKRLLRAEKKKNNALTERIENLFHEVHPSGNWQERKVNFSEFFLVHGNEWLKSCFEMIDPTTPELVMMVD